MSQNTKDAKSDCRVAPRTLEPEQLHPLATRQYNIITPQLLQLVDRIFYCIETGVTGVSVEGRSRGGKTRAKKALVEALARRFNRLAVYSLIARPAIHMSESGFYGAILQSQEHKCWDEGWTEARHRRLVDKAKQDARSGGWNRLVLMIDNAECLKPQQFEWLSGIFDELDDVGVEMFVFSFGRGELSRTRETLIRDKLEHIISRFFNDTVQWRGISKIDELAGCLEGYDTGSEYPPESKISYTRFFFPRPFAGGWRLAAYAKDIWLAFEAVFRTCGNSGRMEIPMKYLARCVERLLIEARLNEDGVPDVSGARFRELVEATGFGAAGRGGSFMDDVDDEDEREDGK